MFTLLLYALCTYIIYHFLFSDVDIDELGAEKDSIGIVSLHKAPASQVG